MALMKAEPLELHLGKVDFTAFARLNSKLLQQLAKRGRLERQALILSYTEWGTWLQNVDYLATGFAAAGGASRRCE